MIKLIIELLHRRQSRLENNLTDLADGITGDMVAVMGKVDTLIDSTTELNTVFEEYKRNMEARFSKLEESFKACEEDLDELVIQIEELQEALSVQKELNSRVVQA